MRVRGTNTESKAIPLPVFGTELPETVPEGRSFRNLLEVASAQA